MKRPDHEGGCDDGGKCHYEINVIVPFDARAYFLRVGMVAPNQTKKPRAFSLNKKTKKKNNIQKMMKMA